MADVEHPSDSSVQRRAEIAIIAAAADLLKVELLAGPGRITLTGDVWVEVDAKSPDNSVFVEAYARQGSLKGAQLKKIGRELSKPSCNRALPPVHQRVARHRPSSHEGRRAGHCR